MNKTITFFKSKLHEGTDIVTVTIQDLDGKNKSVFYCPMSVVHEIVSCNL